MPRDGDSSNGAAASLSKRDVADRLRKGAAKSLEQAANSNINTRESKVEAQMPTECAKGVESIAGLREQIMANAKHALPSVTCDYIDREMKTSETFDVIICDGVLHPDKKVMAKLTNDTAFYRETTMFGDEFPTVEGALLSLLKYTGNAAEKILQSNKSTNLGPGVLNASLVKDTEKLLKEARKLRES